ncbi:unnamed protein product, partial [marine sediment metagenome]
MNKNQLFKACRNQGLDTSGGKAVLEARLAAAHPEPAAKAAAEAEAEAKATADKEAEEAAAAV